MHKRRDVLPVVFFSKSPGSGPRAPLPEPNLSLCPPRADGLHGLSPSRAFVVSFVFVMDWPVCFGSERHHVGGSWSCD